MHPAGIACFTQGTMKLILYGSVHICIVEFPARMHPSPPFLQLRGSALSRQCSCHHAVRKSRDGLWPLSHLKGPAGVCTPPPPHAITYIRTHTCQEGQQPSQKLATPSTQPSAGSCTSRRQCLTV